MKNNFDPRIDWDTLKEIRDQWQGKLIIKGIMDAEDERRCCEIGIDSIIVSNTAAVNLKPVQVRRCAA